jgi:EAL domain-containing protein (putative c-di-GMP-specific phosphodiesterase class I)/GGDEF domain-containing protein
MNSSGIDTQVAAKVRLWQQRTNMRLFLINACLMIPLIVLGHWPVRSVTPANDLGIRLLIAASAAVGLISVALVPRARQYAARFHALSIATLFFGLSLELIESNGTAIDPVSFVLAIFGATILYPEVWSLLAIFCAAFIAQLVFTIASGAKTDAMHSAVAVFAAYAISYGFGYQNIRSRLRECELRLRNEAMQQEQIEFLKYYDAVTELPNRERLIEAIRAYAPDALTSPSLLAVNVKTPEFSPFDPDAPRAQGLLHAVSSQLRTVLDAEVRMFRGSGATLLLWQTGTQVPGALDTLARQVLEILALPLSGLGDTVYARVALATHTFTGEEADVASVVDALESVFTRGANDGSIVSLVTSPQSDKQLERMQQLQARLETALRRGEFTLHYQPVVDRSGRLVEVEALIRWQHPDFGLLMPAEFIGLAEQSGLIIEIGDWVMREAARQSVLWRRGGLDIVTAFNVSCRQFTDESFLTRVKAAIDDSGAQPDRLKLEVTESLAMEDVALTSARLSQCKQLEMLVAIDDFGTGYSSLAYLHTLPFDVIKIDRSFVSLLPENRAGSKIVLAVIALAHSLGRSAHAEGVETEGQARWLLMAECDEFQGYHFARAIPADDVASWNASNLRSSLAQRTVS